MLSRAYIERTHNEYLEAYDAVFCATCTGKGIPIYHRQPACKATKLPKYERSGNFILIYAPRKKEVIARFRVADSRMVEYNGTDAELAFYKNAVQQIAEAIKEQQ